MKKLVATIMLGALLVVGAFTATNQSTDTAMEVEPTVFSMNVETPSNLF